MKPSGFTLAELLIALVILGVIATFTIPKILQSQQDEKRKAVFRETIAMLSDITNQKARTGQAFANATELKNFFRDNMNYVKRCPTDPNAEGCWSGDSSGTAGNADAYILHNGAFITSLNAGAALDRETISIDWNGLEPPNTWGQDILGVIACFAPNNCNTGAAITGSGPKKPGVVGPNGAAAEAIFDDVFSD